MKMVMCKRAACFAEIQLSIMEAGENEKELHLCEAIPQLIRYPKTARYFWSPHSRQFCASSWHSYKNEK